jgi:hypothetical protein
MQESRRFYNEQLPTRTASLFNMLLAVMFFFLMAMLEPYLRRHRYSATGINWIMASALSVAFILISLFEKILISIHFDYENKVVNITLRTILERDKIHEIPFAELAYREGKNVSRAGSTKTLELFNGSSRVIKLKATNIGDYTFSEISKALTTLKP